MSNNDIFQPIEWTDSMATGVAKIDKQHHYLVDTLQEANRNLLMEGGDALVNQVIKDLLGYAIMHFETEELLMQKFNYAEAHPDQASTHISQHREFSRKVVAISDQLHEGHKVSRLEILKFLNHWLRDHVLGIDQLLGDFLTQHSSDRDSHHTEK